MFQAQNTLIERLAKNENPETTIENDGLRREMFRHRTRLSNASRMTKKPETTIENVVIDNVNDGLRREMFQAQNTLIERLANNKKTKNGSP